MKGFSTDIEAATLGNDNFRKVIYTAKNSQLVLMCLQPGEDIGLETHPNDQFFRVESGTGRAVIDGNEYNLSSKSVVIVPAGCEHNVTNTSDSDVLQLYTLYSPPHHKDGIVRKTKAEAVADDPEFDGQTTEQ